MTESTDHAARAREIARDALKFVQKTMDTKKAPVSYADAGLIFDTAQTQMAAAQIEATLALVAAQDRANELKRIEILAHISYGPTILDENRSATVAESEVWQALHDQTGQRDPLAPSIAASLGLGGESDGE